MDSHQEVDQEANGKKIQSIGMSDALPVNQKTFYCIACLQIASGACPFNIHIVVNDCHLGVRLICEAKIGWVYLREPTLVLLCQCPNSEMKVLI